MVKEIDRPVTETSKDRKELAIKASERNASLKREEQLETILKKVGLQDTTDDFKNFTSFCEGLLFIGFDTSPILTTLAESGRLSVDRGGAGRILIRDLYSPPKIYTGLGPIQQEEEPPGFFARIWDMMPWVRKS